MFIINITVFYLNVLIKEYNLFNLRNLLYGNSDTCFVINKNRGTINNTYGTIPNMDKYTCTTHDLNTQKNGSSNETYSTRWVDLYNYFDIDTGDIDKELVDNKIDSIIMVGLYTTIYGILYFLLIYTCDYLAFWNKIEPLKVIPYLVLLIVFIIYIVVINNYDIIEMNNKSSVFDINDVNNLTLNNVITPENRNKLKNDYQIKHILNNILIITIINTIIFATHKFYD